MKLNNFTLKKLAKLTNSKVIGDDNLLVEGVNSLEHATEKEISFLANSRYLNLLSTTKAGVICIAKDIPAIENKNLLLCDNPSLTFQKIIDLFTKNTQSAFLDIHKTAVIHPSAKLGKNVSIGPNVVIDKNAIIQDNTQIYPNTYIGAFVEIGFNCTIYSNVSIRENCILKNNIIIQPGAVIGSCGFGYILNNNQHQKLSQIGSILIEDNVEIGANTTIDRARFAKTIIKKGSKIDNLVQIAHNVEIGENNIIAAQTGIAGSSKTGKNVVMGGQVGVAGHLNLNDNVQIGAQSGISKSLKPGKYRGTPAEDYFTWNKKHAFLRKLPQYLKKLEEKIDKLNS